MDNDKVIRDSGGRFSPGTAPGPGRPPSGVNELKAAVENAVTAEHLTAIMRRATRMALEGNLSAMRFVIERSCGRPVEATADPAPLAIELPRMRTASDCDAAVQKITDAIVKGTISESAAKLLFEAIQTRLKALQTVDFEARLMELEHGATLVQRPKDRR